MAKFEDQVNETVEKFVTGADGKLSLPEGYDAPEEVVYAAKIEKRRRDTYSSLTKVKNEVVTLRAENEEMVKQWEQDAIKNLSKKDQAELDELKASDPDAWKDKLEHHQTKAREAFLNRTTDIKNKAQRETELERRKRLVEEHNAANPDTVLTDDVIENDVPPRITKKLADGEISFEEFLAEASQFLSKGKVIAPGAKAPEDVDFDSMGGSSKPKDTAIEADISASYKKVIF